MKIREISFAILSSIVSFYAVIAMIGGVRLTGTATYSTLLLTMLFFFLYIAPHVRHFFLLPNAFYIDVLMGVALLLVYFWLVTTFIGGLRVTPLSPAFVAFVQEIFPRAKFSEFGTIVMVSMVLGTVYQSLIWLRREK